MAEADEALRDEMAKVREKSRLQALAQGLSTGEAESRAAAAVAEFCAKWGIRPEMAAAAPRSSAPTSAPAPAPAPARSFDLGSSPLRSLQGSGDLTQPIRIGDLLKKVKSSSRESGAPGPSHTGPRPTLGSLLDRVRSRNLPSKAGAAEPTAKSAPAFPSSAPATQAPSTPLPPIKIRHIPVHQQVASVPGGEAVVAAAASLADRRTQIMEEFDRTYAEVQEMIETRISESQGEDPAGDGPAGKGTGPSVAGFAAYTAEDIQFIARDLERLRGGLRSMLSLCEELMSHLGHLIPKPEDAKPGGDAP